MSQTLAVFYDAYRALNARKMFWVVLLLSALVAGAFACVGVNERGITFICWQLVDHDFYNSEFMPPAEFYKILFVGGIHLWLAIAASVLALISTAGMFPDLINSGSIHLLISKPIGRLRLFALQYLAGLLFVTLQVVVFTLASFLVIGLRGGAWEPSLFLAVPIVVCFFSYLFSMCVFVGILTRSSMAALLLTILFWLFVVGVGAGEQITLDLQKPIPAGAFHRGPPGMRDGRSSRFDRPGTREATPRPTPKIQALTEPPADDDSTALKRSTKVPRAVGRSLLKVLVAPTQPDEAVADDTAPSWEESQPLPEPVPDRFPTERWPTDSTASTEPPEEVESQGSTYVKLAHTLFRVAGIILPKTGDTVSLLDRYLVEMAGLPSETTVQPTPQSSTWDDGDVDETNYMQSVWWILGTSLGFEALVLAGAALLFCRRDY